VAELVFFSGTMDCGKSTLALQMHHNHAARGRDGVLFTRQDRAGNATISSRLGLQRRADEVDDTTDFWAEVVTRRTRGRPVDYLVADEAAGTVDEASAPGAHPVDADPAKEAVVLTPPRGERVSSPRAQRGSTSPQPAGPAAAPGDGDAAPGRDDAPAAAERRPRRTRAKVPSWDEIVFGAKPE